MRHRGIPRFARRLGRWHRALIALALLAWSVSARHARGQTAGSVRPPVDRRQACIHQHEHAQVLRRAGRLGEARAALLTCAQDQCPAIVRTDCLEWYDEVSNLVPTVVLGATSGGRDLFDVQVSIDGRVVASRLEGKEIEVDPGPHVLHFEIASGESISEDVLLLPGEKNRRVSATFGSPPPVVAVQDVTKLAKPSRSSTTYRPTPRLAYLFGAVALVGAGGFAGFGIWGLRQERALTCAPTCDQGVVTPIRRKFLIADVSLGTAVASTLVASYLYASRSTVEKPATLGDRPLPLRARRSTTLIVTPLASGALVDMAGEF